jgi:uncharacterized protein (TIGR00251 family)
MNGPVSARADGIEIAVRVQPGAQRTESAGLHGEQIKIRVAAPPVDGKGNVALLGFLSDRLGVPQRQIRIVAGARSRSKRVAVQGTSAKAARAALGLA